jgi:hypothetical protein
MLSKHHDTPRTLLYYAGIELAGVFVKDVYAHP